MRSYLAILLTFAAVSCGSENSSETPLTSAPQTSSQFSAEEISHLEQRAANVEILRDRWGIPHIYGETDADTVFGTLSTLRPKMILIAWKLTTSTPWVD